MKQLESKIADLENYKVYEYDNFQQDNSVSYDTTGYSSYGMVCMNSVKMKP